MIKVLVVDDSALMRRVLTGILRDAGDFEVFTARDGVEALARLHETQPDVVTLDVTMPNMGGLDCLDHIMLDRPTPVVMFSALTEAGADATLAALQMGAVDFLAKPEGAVSLAIEDLAPVLIEKVRHAALSRLPKARRLAERVRRGQALVAPAPRLARESIQPQKPRTQPVLSADAVVLVGASTGGPPALDALLTRLPENFPWPVVVAQHMPAAFTGPLARRLDRACKLRVTEVTGPVPLLPKNVFIGRGDTDIVVGRHGTAPVVMAAAADPAYRWHPSVDRLVTSAMAHFSAPHLIGVLMTGMGNDGAASMAALHRAGGRTIAEAEETAIVWGMPGELFKAGGAGDILRREHIAGKLLEWVP